MSQSGYVYLEDCTIKSISDAAIEVVYEGERIWFPKSQMQDFDRLEKGDENVTVCVTEWIAKQKNIEVD